MAGFLSTSDIEDVVSSVRRLVSVDGRTRPVTRELAGDPLLLTPALRIVADAPPADLAPGQDEPAPMAEAGPIAQEAPIPEEAPIAEEAPILEAVPIPEDAPNLEAALPEPDAVPLAAEPVADLAEAPPPPAAADQALPEAEDLAADQPDTRALPDIDPDAEPEVAAPAAQPLQLVEDEWEDEIWSESDPSLAELALGAEEAELVVPGAEAGLFADDDETALARPPIDPDAAWAQVDGDWADDLPDPVVPFAPHRARSLAQQAQQPAAAPPRTEAVELTDPDGNPLTILDEAALQEVVRQLIREELQGGLGERITRNVRKLVRAEINRALTARALD